MDNNSLVLLSSVARRLNITIDQLWEAALKQVLVEGIISSLIALGLAVAAAITPFLFQLLLRKMQYWGTFRTEEEKLALSVIKSAAIVLLVILAFSNLFDAVRYFSNPEYMALKLLMGK